MCIRDRANLDRVAIYGLGQRLTAELPASRGKGQIFKVFDFLAGLTPEGLSLIHI